MVCAIRMNDGTIYYSDNHYYIVLKIRSMKPKKIKDIESFGYLDADGTYTIKSGDPTGYMKNHY